MDYHSSRLSLLNSLSDPTRNCLREIRQKKKGGEDATGVGAVFGTFRLVHIWRPQLASATCLTKRLNTGKSQPFTFSVFLAAVSSEKSLKGRFVIFLHA